MATSGVKWGVSGVRFMTKIDSLVLEIGVQVQQQVSSRHVNTPLASIVWWPTMGYSFKIKLIIINICLHAINFIIHVPLIFKCLVACIN